MTFFTTNNCKKRLSKPILLGVALAFTSVAGAGAPFGNKADLEYAATLWSALETKGLVGANPIYSKPYAGTEPHGFVLETLEAKVTVGKHNNWAVVKRNYGPAGISTETVSNEREKHLKAVTVMFKRESGYDSDPLAGHYFCGVHLHLILIGRGCRARDCGLPLPERCRHRVAGYVHLV